METLRTTINDLPCELLILIWNRFDLIDILEFRFVCKRWSEIIKNEMKFKECNIIDEQYKYFFNNSNTWFKSNQPLDCSKNIYFFPQNPFPKNYINSILFKSLFYYVKYLNFNHKLNETIDFNLELVNHFKFIEQLEILKFNCSNVTKLNLPNLNTLAIYKLTFRDDDNCLIINAKKLCNLLCDYNLNRIEFGEPNSIEYLEIKGKSNDLKYLEKFKNLKIFYCNLDNLFYIDLFLNLKQLNLFLINNDIFNDTYKSTLIKLLDDRLTLKRTELIITFQGIPLEHNNQLIDFYSNNLNLQLDNYSKLVQSPWLKALYLHERDHFDCLATKLQTNMNLQNNLFIKLNNIQVIILYHLIEYNENHLLILLTKVTNLRYLCLNYSLLSQNFYNNLPIIQPFLNRLKVFYNEDLNSFDEVNFTVLMSKFQYLLRLETDYTIKPYSVSNYFKNNRHLLYLEFRNCRDQIEVRRISKDRFKIVHNLKFYYDNLNLIDLSRKLLDLS